MAAYYTVFASFLQIAGVTSPHNDLTSFYTDVAAYCTDVTTFLHIAGVTSPHNDLTSFLSLIHI